MSDAWPRVPLGECFDKNEDWIVLDPTAEYREVTVRLWGKGVVLRGVTTGAEVAADRRVRVRAGQFILSRIDARNGASGVVPPSLDRAIVSGDFPAFEVRRDRLLPEFLGWLAKTQTFVDMCLAASEGTTNRVRLKEDRFLASAIPLPPLAEQRRIVARLDALAAKIEEAKGLRTDSDERAARLLSVILNGLERSLRADASLVRLGALVTQHDSGWSPQCGDTPALSDGWGVLKTTCVQWYGFQWHENKALPEVLEPRPEITVRKGDVLITRAGPVNRVGIACAVPDDQPTLMLSDKIVRLRLQSTASPEYVALCLRFPSVQEQFRHSKTGLAESQVNIPREKLLALEVPLPNLEKQTEAVAFVKGTVAKLEGLSRESQAGEVRVRALLPSLLDRAFAGAL